MADSSGGSPVAMTILASALTALVVMLGAYFSFIRNAVSRGEMQNYVQTQSPFAHDQALFQHMELTLGDVQAAVTRLQLQNQREQDRIDNLRDAIARLERGERRSG